ncbi:hypothetical protein SAMN05444398_104281 [Roseovarius pacificus]|uniref:Uncharacterized protein n=1 Tax=Roseovarius pacificus TaxID=337701 RepID=A0A1M7CKW3_9RHOB|nr:hypothetical protein SAMN05444398_104281 [Roseovarius pacificus]
MAVFSDRPSANDPVATPIQAIMNRAGFAGGSNS